MKSRSLLIAALIAVAGTDSYGVTFIPMASKRSTLDWPIENPVFDSFRGRVYFPTGEGTVERFDVAQNALLSPIVLGGDLWGADTTPDGRYLYVTDRTLYQEGLDYFAKIHKVDLETDLASEIAIPRHSPQSVGTFEIAIASNGRAFVSDEFLGGGLVRAFDTTTDQAVNVDDVKDYEWGSGPMTVTRGPSRERVLMFSRPESSTRLYTVSTNHIERDLANPAAYERFGKSAISRDGSLISIEERLYSSDMTHIGTLPIPQDFVSGLVFDPLQDVLYVADKNASVIRAFRTPDLKELGRFADTIDLSPTSAEIDRSRPNKLAISGDGRLLFVPTEVGIWVLNNTFAIPEPGMSSIVAGCCLALVGRIRRSAVIGRKMARIE